VQQLALFNEQYEPDLILNFVVISDGGTQGGRLDHGPRKRRLLRRVVDA